MVDWSVTHPQILIILGCRPLPRARLPMSKRPRASSDHDEEYEEPTIDEFEHLNPIKSFLHNVITGVDEFITTAFKDASIKVVDKERTICSCTRTHVLLNFLDAWSALEDPTEYEFVFHGTAQDNIESIARRGLDPEKRCGQQKGPGEYFSKKPSLAYRYAKESKKLFLFLILKDKSGITYDGDTVVVVHKVEHQLPLFILHLEVPSDELEKRTKELEKQVKDLQNEVYELRRRL